MKYHHIGIKVVQRSEQDIGRKRNSQVSYKIPYYRVSIFVTIRKETDLLINDLITELSETFGGLTMSRYQSTRKEEQPMFIGSWRDPETKNICKDDICWMVVDVDSNLKIDPVKYFGKLKENLESSLAEKLVWIVFYDAHRIVM